MKRALVVVSVAVSVALLSGCAKYRQLRGEGGPVAVKGQAKMQAQAAPVAQKAPEVVGADGVAIERVPFRAGVSSATVENMAKKVGCWGTQGAGLMTPQGPVEIYRLVCDNGAIYMAKCELRQCKPMPAASRPPVRPPVPAAAPGASS